MTQTNDFNRYSFLADSQTRLDTARETGLGVALVLFTLDGAAAAGEAELSISVDHFVAAARRCLRRLDVFERIGPEAFAAMLSNISREQAHAVAERVLRAFALPARGGTTPGAVVSAGIAFADARETDLPRLMQAAGGALEYARASGGNRVASGSAGMPPIIH